MSSARKPIRVLVADDNDDHLFLTVRALRDTRGVVLEVDTVSDGEETLDYLYRRGRFTDRPRPNLILLDLKMPKCSGLEVLERLKDDAELRQIPVVVLTSSERREDICETYRRGASSYVTKPSTVAGFRLGLTQLSEYWTKLASLPEPGQ